MQLGRSTVLYLVQWSKFWGPTPPEFAALGVEAPLESRVERGSDNTSTGASSVIPPRLLIQLAVDGKRLWNTIASTSS